MSSACSGCLPQDHFSTVWAGRAGDFARPCVLGFMVSLVPGCLSCPWVSLPSLRVYLLYVICLGVPLVPGRLICPWVSVLSRGPSLVLGCLSRPWVSLLSLGVYVVPGLALGS